MCVCASIELYCLYILQFIRMPLRKKAAFVSGPHARYQAIHLNCNVGALMRPIFPHGRVSLV